MASATKRRFTDEFKREAVALWETAGRMQTEMAAELGTTPTLLRRRQRKLGDSRALPTGPTAKPPAATATASFSLLLEDRLRAKSVAKYFQ